MFTVERKWTVAAAPWAIFMTFVAADPARAVSVIAIPVAQGQLTTGLSSGGLPISNLVVVPVTGSPGGGPPFSGEVFGVGQATRTSSNAAAFEFSLAPLNSLQPVDGYTITSATLTVNYAGGSNFGSNGSVGSPTMLVSGYRDADGVLTLADFNQPTLFSAARGGLPSVPPPDFISPQSFDATSFVQLLYDQRAPFAGFRFDAVGSMAINGFNFSDASRRPTLTIVAAIPEPETYALMLAGLGVLGFAAKRRQLS